MTTSVEIEVLGIEIVQSIQNLEHDIPLLAEKKTVVRVYVRPMDLPHGMVINGWLCVSHSRTGVCKLIKSEKPIHLCESNHPDLETQRTKCSTSFYFFLPDTKNIEDENNKGENKECLQRECEHRGRNNGGGKNTEGDLMVRLGKVESVVTGGPDILVRNIYEAMESVDFLPKVTLRVRAVGLRYRDRRSGVVYAPESRDFDALHSYLTRAFPVSEVEWSTVTVDAVDGFGPPFSKGSDPSPELVWQENVNLAHAQIMAMRARDIELGVDQRTRYYGLVKSPDDDFFVGAVSDVPTENLRPDVVGVGPTEVGAYGAHELAHALGRTHPGFCEGQQREDDNFPRSYDGKISSAEVEHNHVGFDVGDDFNPPQALSYDRWYDLMSYCEPVWPSAYTYKGIYERLKKEDEELLGEVGKRALESGDCLQIIGIYDLAANAGSLNYLFPVKKMSLLEKETRNWAAKEVKEPTSRESLEPTVVVEGEDENGIKLFRVNVGLKQPLADLPQESGTFQITVPRDDALTKVKLYINNKEVDEYPRFTELRRFAVSGTVEQKTEPFDIQVSAPCFDAQDPYVLRVTPPESHAQGIYTVQVRRKDWKATDIDESVWQTIGQGLRGAADLYLDKDQFGLPSIEDWVLRSRRERAFPVIKVRVLCSDGFTEHAVDPIEINIASLDSPVHPTVA